MQRALRVVQNSITLRLLLVHDMNETERLSGIAALGQWLEEGRLADTVGRRLPLARIAGAHETVERRGLGSAVLEIS
jgi:NADPH:quinone reductase